VTPFSIGLSVEGRPLTAWADGGCAPSGGLLVFGGIHGDEPGSAELCARFRATKPRGPVCVVDAVNPDGLTALRKNNTRDIDLNRNFAARNFTRDHKPGYDPGATPLSEPETRALVALIDAQQPSVIVAVHQPFALVNWDGPADDLAAQMAAACGYPASASIGYPTPGSFGSWWGVDLGRPVITFELPRPVPDADWPKCLDALGCAMLVAVGNG
jgi:protein MpaA